MKKRFIERNRELLKSEKGTVFKDPGGRVTICLVYPNTYHVGMSNLGFTGMYSLLNGRDDVACERAFLPDRGCEDEFKKTRTELFSMESERPVREFDVVGFSLSFENDYPNVLKILSLSNIDCYRSERKAGAPLVVMGGPCAFMNPEPLADFMDVVFVGEAEEMVDDFIKTVKKEKTRERVLRSLSLIEGFYIPSCYEPRYSDDGKILDFQRICAGAPHSVKRRYTEDIDGTIISSRIAASNTEFKDMFLIEAMRGCPFSCRFCAAGHIYNPPRRRSLKVLSREIEKAQKKYSRVGLIAPSLSEYGGIGTILKMKGVSFSITSLRASKKSAEILPLLRDKKSVSIAPEAGSRRLRDIINKRITEEDVLTAAELIFKSDIKTLRLYFMVGLPYETDEDIEAIVELSKRIRSISKKGMITLSLSTFVPKPFTPFQWYPMTDINTVKKRIKAVKKGLAVKGIRVFHDAIRDAYMQGLFAVGDRRVSRALYIMNTQKDLRRACKEAGVDPDFYISREKAFNERLPWGFIDNGIPPKKLWNEFIKAGDSIRKRHAT